MLVRILPLVTGFLPIIGIHVSLVVSMTLGPIEPCFPYIDGCASISATGRYEPASFIFKPAMMSSWRVRIWKVLVIVSAPFVFSFLEQRPCQL